MKRLILITLPFLLFISGTVSAFTQNVQLPSEYRLSCEFLPEHANYSVYSIPNNSFMRGRANVTFPENISGDIVFYLHGELWIDSILVRNNRIDYEYESVFCEADYSNAGIKVSLKNTASLRTDEIEIRYSGYFNASKARSISNFMRVNKEDGVLLRSFGYSLWFPVFEGDNLSRYESEFSEVKVITPAEYQTVICGELIENYIEGDRRICVWKPGFTDISEVQCVARKYKILDKQNVAVYYLMNEDSQIYARSILEYSAKLKDLFSKNLRQVNTDKKVIVCEMPRYGDISSDNVIGLSEKRFRSFDNELWSKSTLAHEMLHPYVHIPVEPDNPFYSLVIEGLPSFMQVWAMARMEPESFFNLSEATLRYHNSYLQKRKTGKTTRGFVLPAEKPILDISGEEIGSYKDTFVLADRVWLFMIYLWNKMGDDSYDDFLRELFNMQLINYDVFEELILKYIPGSQDDVNIWLKTSDYPERFYPIK